MLNALIPATAEPMRQFRVHAVVGDSLEPILRGGRDYVLITPVNAYDGEGLYLIDTGLGVDIFRVSNVFDGKGGLCLSKPNKRYHSHMVDRDRFNEVVLGIVAADIVPRDIKRLAGVMQ